MALYTCPRCNNKSYLADKDIKSAVFQKEFRCSSCGATYGDLPLVQTSDEETVTAQERPVFFTPGTKKCLCISIPCILIAALLLYALIGGNTSIAVAIGLAITATFGFFPLYACISEYISDCKHYRQSPEDYAEYKARRFEELQKFGQEQQQQYEDMRKRMEEEQREKQEAKRRVPPCPVCDKQDKVVRISTLNRSASVAAFGLASSKIGKQYQCKRCNHLF